MSFPLGKFTATNNAGVSLQHGNVVRLKCASTNKNLRFFNDQVNGEGGDGDLTVWTVISRGPNLISLRWNKDPSKYLAINNDKLFDGSGGVYCIFRVHVSDHDKEYISFESVKHPGQHMGILPTGNAKEPSKTGKGAHGSFMPIVMDITILLPPTQCKSTAYWSCQHGNVIYLTSASCGKNFRVNPSGEIDCKGEWGDYAKWIVETRGGGKVVLRCYKDPMKYLAVHKNKLDTDVGATRDELILQDPTDPDKHPHSICFAKAENPNWHVGVLPDGKIKEPDETGNGGHGTFIVKVAENIHY